jgi:hypothetical protein
VVDIPQRSLWGAQARGDQIYMGPGYADSYAARNLALVGQVSPYVRESMRREHGRYLSGLGGEGAGGAVASDSAYGDRATLELEDQDDTYGSGVFDEPGRSGTSNPNMGVFASHYSWPGYLAREIPFTVSRDVSDVTDDADVVGVPGGGLAYVEHRGRLTDPAILGPTWRPPSLHNAGYTQRDQVFAFLNRPCDPPRPPLNPNAPVRPPPRYRPRRHPTTWVEPVPQSPDWQRMPRTPRYHVLPRQEIISPEGEPSIALGRYGRRRGVGQDEKAPASAGQLAVAGFIAGVAAGLVVIVVGKKKRA